jgi:transcriptional regulator with XRE-family HTH domain
MNDKQDVKNYFSKRLYEAIKNKNLEKNTYKELGKLFNVSNVVIYKWLNSKAMPSMARIPLIAEKLEVSVEYLLGIEVEQKTTNTLEKELLKNFRKLSDKQQQNVVKLLESF